MQLKEIFYHLLQKYTSDERLISTLWTEIETNYSNKKRHYHNLAHLSHLLTELNQVNDKIHDWETVLFTLFYHDVIYNTRKSDNEEKSAELAEKRMKELNVPDHMIQLCKTQIISTKSHVVSENPDTNYFTDADLSVLGKDWKTYETYYKNIRKEYAIYPALVYNPGRKKVLNHFLDMPRIFKTDWFYQLYEQPAKENLQKELETL